MSIASEGDTKVEIKQLWKRVEELESAVLELTTRVRWLETQRPTLGLKKPLTVGKMLTREEQEDLDRG